MNPDELRYTAEHEWIGLQDGLYAVGITDHAQEQLGDITYVELPELDREVARQEEVAVVESVKAASDVYAPVAGKVAAVNESLENEPELVNKEPYGAGWFFKLEAADPSQLEELMDAAAYKAFLEENAE